MRERERTRERVKERKKEIKRERKKEIKRENGRKSERKKEIVPNTISRRERWFTNRSWWESEEFDVNESD